MHYTSIVKKDGYNGGQPSLTSGHTVLQVVKLLEGPYSEEEAASRLGIPVDQIYDGWSYYQENTEEIEAIREEQRRVLEEFDAGAPPI